MSSANPAEPELQIPFDMKDKAKETAQASGGYLLWNGRDGGPKTWTYRGPLGSFPKELEEYLVVKNEAHPNRDRTVLAIDYTYFALAQQCGARYNKAEGYYYFEGNKIPIELSGFDPEPYSREERIQRMLDRESPKSVRGNGSFEERDYQTEAVREIYKNYKAGNPGFLLADDLGLGKTVSSWLAAQKLADDMRKKKPCIKILVVGPLGTLPAWRNTIQALGHGPDDILVTNYQRLKKLLEFEDPKQIKSLAGAARRGKAEEFDIIIFDESHRMKNTGAAVSKIGMKLANSAGYLLWLSATAGQKALELAYLAPLLASRTQAKTSSILKDFEKWCETENLGVSRGKYGKWIVDETKQAESERRIHELIFKPDIHGIRGGIRRLPSQIAGWPERQIIPHRTEIEARYREAYNKEWHDFLAWIQARKTLANAKEATVKGLAALTQLRQKASMLKTPSSIELILELLENDRNVAVSCFFHKTMEEIRTKLAEAKIQCSVMHGSMSAKEKEHQRLLYQTEKNPVILFSMEEGINLHAGEHGTKPRAQVNHDIRWSAISMRQIDGRSHRNGQFAPIYWTILADTVEDRVAEILLKKTQGIDTLNGDGNSLDDIAAILSKAGVI